MPAGNSRVAARRVSRPSRAGRRARRRAATRAACTSAACIAGGGRGRAEVADQRDADRAGVEPRARARRSRSSSIPPSRPSKTCAEAVDEEVVADVVPAVRPHVVDLDPAHDRRPTGPACTRSCRRCGGRPRAAAPVRYCGGAREIFSSAPHAARGTIGGEPAIESVRGARGRAGSRPEVVRAQPRTRPAVRNWTPSRGAVQSRLPSCQPGMRLGRAADPGRRRRRRAARRSSGRRATACGTQTVPGPASAGRPC